MLNYAVDEQLLAPRVPKGTSLDFHDGKLFISVVGFMFLDTKVLGIPVPFHVNFEEVNLRFYVKRETPDEVRRGVCFIKEIVPLLAVAKLANWAYGEPYERWSMSHERTESLVAYEFWRGERRNRLAATIDEYLGEPAAGTEGEFIIEHYWGYTKRGESRTDEYRVAHPKWELFSVKDVEIGIDFVATYGEEFAFMNSATPHSVLLAKGSEIEVYKGASL